jgi:secreted Zn-dependent insulinase-like peptidase
LPAERGDDMRAALQAFHGRYYSAHLMTVVILGQEPLDILQVT